MFSSTDARSESQNRLWRSAGPLLVLFALWCVLGWAGALPEAVFPAPWHVARTLVSGFEDESFIFGIFYSVERIAIGFGISAMAGIVLGILMGRFERIDDAVSPIALGLQALPSICWLPLAALWFGLTETAILFVVVMGSLLSITLATQAAVKNASPRYLQAARTLGARGWNVYFRVLVPASLPTIVAGLKVGWTFAWRSLMSAELLYVSLGLGQLLTHGRDVKDMSLVVSVMLVIIAIGLVVDRFVFSPIESHLRQTWGPQGN